MAARTRQIGAEGRSARRLPRAGARASREPPWADWTDAKLLDLRLCDLEVSVEGTFVERLYETLERRGLRFRPPVWAGSEWFSPVGAPGIVVPFYLLHPRLIRLERKQMLEVEGGSRDECQRILRHECGHAFQQAYRLHRRRRWQKLFGRSSTPYPTHYRPDPASRNHVQHLRLYYAQAHPDEDFAETFAIWLRPRHVWRKRYAGWPALRKLEYVDELMGEIGDAAPPVRTRRPVDSLREHTETLRAHYEERRTHYRPGAIDVFDSDLQKVFASGAEHPRAERASRFLRRHRRRIRAVVRRWTGEYEFTLDMVLDEMIQRVRELDLRAIGATDALVSDFSMMLAVNATHSVYDRRNWIPL
jgi:hypothetical protein